MYPLLLYPLLFYPLISNRADREGAAKSFALIFGWTHIIDTAPRVTLLSQVPYPQHPRNTPYHPNNHPPSQPITTHYQLTLSTHHINSPLSTHPINLPYQPTLSTHPINPPYQLTPINSPYQPNLSTHPINPPYQPTPVIRGVVTSGTPPTPSSSAQPSCRFAWVLGLGWAGTTERRGWMVERPTRCSWEGN